MSDMYGLHHQQHNDCYATSMLTAALKTQTLKLSLTNIYRYCIIRDQVGSGVTIVSCFSGTNSKLVAIVTYVDRFSVI